MPDDRPIIEELIDYAVFAPVGLALTIAEDLPDIVAKGRARVGTQVAVARFAGRVALGRLRRRIDEALTVDDREPPPTSPARPVELTVVHDVPAPGATQAPESTPAREDLGIVGYDTLAASQVVARLASLSPDELEAVRGHEESHRHRRTILNRIAQLQETGRSH